MNLDSGKNDNSGKWKDRQYSNSSEECLYLNKKAQDEKSEEQVQLVVEARKENDSLEINEKKMIWGGERQLKE